MKKLFLTFLFIIWGFVSYQSNAYAEVQLWSANFNAVLLSKDDQPIALPQIPVAMKIVPDAFHTGFTTDFLLDLDNKKADVILYSGVGGYFTENKDYENILPEIRKNLPLTMGTFKNPEDDTDVLTYSILDLAKDTEKTYAAIKEDESYAMIGMHYFIVADRGLVIAQKVICKDVAGGASEKECITLADPTPVTNLLYAGRHYLTALAVPVNAEENQKKLAALNGKTISFEDGRSSTLIYENERLHLKAVEGAEKPLKGYSVSTFEHPDQGYCFQIEYSKLSVLCLKDLNKLLAEGTSKATFGPLRNQFETEVNVTLK